MQTVDQIAEATPAAEDSTEQTGQDLKDLSPAQYQDWLKTGSLPEPKKSDSAPDKAKPEPKAQPDKEAADKAEQTDSETVKQQQSDKRKAYNDRRWDKVLGENAALKARLEALEQKSAAGDGKAKAEPKPEPKAEGPKAPRYKDFAAKYADEAEAWEKYEEARDAHAEQVAEQKAKAAIQADQESKLKEAAKAESKKAVDAWKEAIKQAETKHPDFEDVAFSEDVPLTNLMSGYLVRNPTVGAEILYHWGQNPDEAQAIADMADEDAIEALVLLKQKFTAMEKKTPAPKPITKAKPLATELQGHSADDPLERAYAEDDYVTFEREANARQFGPRR